jgi:3-deoxy-7-phosphoheptulonate synthase
MTSLDTLFDDKAVAAQQPNWPGGPQGEPLAKAVAELKSLPPLVFAGECDELKARIADAAAGKAFWLQGGDCAETFGSAPADSIRNRIKTILQMAAAVPVVTSCYQGRTHGWSIRKATF